MRALRRSPRTLSRRIAGAAALSALALGAWAAPAGAADEFDRYAIESAAVELSSTQAGAHADLTTSFGLSAKPSGNPYARTRDLEFHLPPGVIGNPQAIPRCSVGQLGNLPEESECPLDSQVGTTSIVLKGEIPGNFTEPIYNMEPPGGGDVVARLGFFAAGWPAFVNVRVDPTDYSLVASVEGAPSGAGLVEGSSTLWGIPAAHSHDGERMTPDEARQGQTPPSREAALPAAPFLANPTDCGLSRQLTVTTRSYQLPDRPSSITVPFPQITGCGKLTFNPTLSVVATNPEASAPTGLDAELAIPQNESVGGLASSTMKSAVVTLPEGMAINPAAGDGLAGCSPAQVGFETTEPSHCPDAAKIGSVVLQVPALGEPLKGSVYQRAPEEGKLLRFWLVTDEQGVHLKLPAEIQANPLTGQLTNLFLGIPSLGGNPQVPFSSLALHVFGGPRAPLATPASCGTYQTHYAFAPWSGRAPSEGDTPMQIANGCGKGGFSPGLAAGMLSYGAGKFSPFTFTLTRNDGEAEPRTIALHLPQGLLAKLGGVPLCPEGAAAGGGCPAASQIGIVRAAAGVGPAPLWIPQPGKAPTAVYLAGPYEGAPYSVVAVVPAQAGPFDLGTVVTRSRIDIDPETATATVTTDPLPQILEGVPIAYRALNVEVNRPEFTLNPTGCSEKKISATVTATNGAVAKPSAGFQAANCARLGYSPKLRLTLKGSTRRSGNPALRAVLTQPAGQANTSAASVVLPSSEFIDNAHINNPCTRVQFNENNCPPKSVLGTARAVTPLLDRPLEGPVYFRSNGGERELPDIVADLHGPVHIVLVGFVDSVHRKGSGISRVRNTFASVPDAPVTRFTLSLYGGRRGLFENHVDLCGAKHQAEADFSAQNGRKRKFRPAVKALGCNETGSRHGSRRSAR
ncbi:MAG: hypothetical protein ACJ76D_08730 [Solirubrobacterales bacterium]